MLTLKLTSKRSYSAPARALASLVLAVMLTAAASAPFTPSARAEAESLTQTQIEAAVEEYFASVAAFDVPRFVNNFAPDGVLEDPVGTPPVQGTAAIAGFIGAITAPFSQIKHRIQEITVCGHEAAVNWKLHLTTTTGKKITIDGMGIFNFNQNGKLQSVREFWDLAAFQAQLQD